MRDDIMILFLKSMDNDERPFSHPDIVSARKSPERRAHELSSEILALPAETRAAVSWIIQTLKVELIVNSADGWYIERLISELSRIQRESRSVIVSLSHR